MNTQSVNDNRQQGGRQRDWNKVRAQSDKPIITIITSTYNVAQDLHWTVNSIRSQTYANVQWIVADGASNDGTVELLKQYSDIIDYWFSEPDTGIYDAWNKALEYIQGDWVQFIGAGDELFEIDTIEKVAVHLANAYPTYELVYGQVMHISEKGRKELYVSGEPWESYVDEWEGNRPKLPVQTGIYHHRSYFVNQKRTFNSTYKIVADCHFLLEVLKLDRNMNFIPFVVTVMPTGGISGSIKGGLISYSETNHSMRNLNIKIPLKNYTTSFVKHNFIRAFLYISSEKKCAKFMDSVKSFRGKPKIFTIE